MDGGPVPAEQSLELPGYPGGADKIGNWVNQQFQLDAFGESLQLLAAAARQGRLDTDVERAARTAVETIEQRWTDDDAGIWELDNRPWTQSRLACVAGLRAIAGTPAAGDVIIRQRAELSATLTVLTARLHALRTRAATSMRRSLIAAAAGAAAALAAQAKLRRPNRHMPRDHPW